MSPFRRVLVPLGRTPIDAGLLEYLSLLSHLGLVKELSLVHVDASGALSPEELEAGARPFLQLCPDTQTRWEVLAGDLTDSLLQYAASEQRDLIVLGHRSDHSGRRSLARRLAMKAPASVWMVPEGSTVRIARILCPIDFSERSADALALAVKLARHAGVPEITALHVYFDSSVITFEGQEAQLRRDETEAFSRFVESIDSTGVRLRPLFVESSHIADTVLRVADEMDADVVVLNTRGRTQSASILLGSEAEHTLREARIPVLAVKHFGAGLGLLEALLDERIRKRPVEHFG